VSGTAAGQRLGAAVTIDYPFILAGRPGAALANGAAVLYEVMGSPPASLTLRDTLLGPASSNMGQNVSMSAAYALISGAEDALVWINNGSASVRNYQIREIAPSVPYSFPAFSSGDVSQQGGVAGIGNGPPTPGSAYIIRNPMVDEFLFDGLLLAPAGGDTSDTYIDIRRTREFLFAGNPIQDRAINYRFPAGFGVKQQAVGNSYPYKYMQRSLPCNAVGESVGSVFGALGINGTDYAVYAYDITKRTDPNPYRPLADGYSFVAADLDYSLWIAVAAEKYVDIGSCDTFTVSDVIAPVNGVITGLPAYVRAQKRVKLPDRDGAALFARVMVNNPYPREVNINDIRYAETGGAILTLAQAETNGRILSRFYVYDVNVDPAQQIPSGQYYRVLAPNTPPFGNTLQAQEGFWVRVLANGVTGAATTHALLMPQVE
jgi:hypothetical protein